MLGSRYAIAQNQATEEDALDASRILMMTLYNMQTKPAEATIERPGAGVGTVDQFQGQEAPIVIHSLTASSADGALRGLTFLLEPNRLNVAISRFGSSASQLWWAPLDWPAASPTR